MWNSPLPAPALLPEVFMIRVGIFSVMYCSLASSSSACVWKHGWVPGVLEHT